MVTARISWTPSGLLHYGSPWPLNQVAKADRIEFLHAPDGEKLALPDEHPDGAFRRKLVRMAVRCAKAISTTRAIRGSSPVLTFFQRFQMAAQFSFAGFCRQTREIRGAPCLA